MRIQITVFALAAAVATPTALGAGDRAWRAPTDIAPRSQDLSSNVAVEDDGGAIIASLNPTNGAQFVRRRLTTTDPWSPLTELVPPCGTSCRSWSRVAMNATGTAAVVWRHTDGTRLVTDVRIMSPNGAIGPVETIQNLPWTTDPKEGPAEFDRPIVAVAPSGEVIVVLRTTPFQAHAVRTRSVAGTWTPAVPVAGAPTGDTPIHASADGSVVIQTTVGCIGQTLVRRTPGGVWSTSTPILVDSQCLDARQLAVADDGSMDFVQVTSGASPDGERVAVWHAAPGGTFGSPTTIDDVPGDVVQATPLANGDLAVVWRSVDTGVLIFRLRTASGWQPVSPSPDLGRFGPVAIGRDGSAVVLGQTSHSRALRLLHRSPTGAWDPSATVLNERWSNTMAQLAALASGDALVVAHGPGVKAFDFTAGTRPLATIPPAKGVGVHGPASSASGSVVEMCLRVNRRADTIPVTIQRLRTGRWITISRQLVPTSEMTCNSVRVRLRRTGDARLRLIAGGVTLSPITIRVVTPLRRRVPLGTAPIQIAATDSGVWVLEGVHGLQTPMLRRLDPTSGATAATVALPHYGEQLAVGAGTQWVMERRTLEGFTTQLRRVDGASGAPVRSATSVAADATHVWISRDPSDRATLGAAAVAIDPATGMATTVTGGAPLQTTRHVDLVEGTLWLSGQMSGHPNVVAADATSGAPTGVPTRYNFSTRLKPMSATTVWGIVRDTPVITRILPTSATIYAATRGSIIRDVARSGGKAWVLEESVNRDASRRPRQRLVQVSFPTGARTGRVIDLGTVTPAYRQTQWYWPLDGPLLTIRNRIAWILIPGEGAAMRVPLT